MPSTVTALRSFDDVSLPPPVASAGAAPPNNTPTASAAAPSERNCMNFPSISAAIRSAADRAAPPTSRRHVKPLVKLHNRPAKRVHD